MPPSPDANIGFTLTPEARTGIRRIIEGLAGELPQSTVVLTDFAGRIVDIARKPVGLNVEAIAALAAGVHASTRALANTMGDSDFSMLFEHDADRVVYIRPLCGKALFLVLLKGAAAADSLDNRLEGQFGTDLANILEEAREPLKAVPPPRVDLSGMPDSLGDHVRKLGIKLLDFESRKGASVPPEVHGKMVRAREDLVQALAHRDWDRAEALCRTTESWLVGQG